jgi:hypothetical protein
MMLERLRQWSRSLQVAEGEAVDKKAVAATIIVALEGDGTAS